VLDGQRIGQPQVVFWDNIGVDESHDHLLSADLLVQDVPML
jgi:hypothetical protein